MISKLFLTSIFVGVVFLSFTGSASAATPPTFPACSNPQGTLKVNYDQGSHGIVGDLSENRGTDAVYTLNTDTLLQCFCSEDGRGIQTNWWKVSSLTDEEIQTLKNSGWFFVANGALWGLASAPYLAKNSDYTCRGGPGGAVLSATTRSTPQVLGLATTGNAASIAALAVLGVVLLLLGILLAKISARKI